MPEGQVILVTGSSRGIGATLVANFARAGHRAVLNYAHSDEEANRLFSSLAKEGGVDRVMKVKADVARRDEVKAMFDRVLEKFGRMDALVNNAGLNIDGPFPTMTDTQWDRVIATNLTGTFICSQEFAFHFTGDVGHTVNVSASTAIRGRTNGANYCSAKAGVLALTKCLALELAPAIRVNCILPGRINTEEVMTRLNLHDPANYEAIVKEIPVGRLGITEDVFRVVRFIIEDSDYITGQNFFVNGGNFMC
jgi:NAD(P)-dependent dehydrogenase (short-subunit alcohol dehydrogenase family)